MSSLLLPTNQYIQCLAQRLSLLSHDEVKQLCEVIDSTPATRLKSDQPMRNLQQTLTAIAQDPALITGGGR